ncbi:MAG: VOC family protein, partial [Dehalococcoidia bacterium]
GGVSPPAGGRRGELQSPGRPADATRLTQPDAGRSQHLPAQAAGPPAAIAPDLDATTRFWTEVLELPLAGEVRTTTTIIRQFKLDDAIIALLGPAIPDSPLAQRPPGLVSMIACEVVDIDAAVTQARAAGFTVADPAPGALPHTRVTSIPGSELSGLALQLLEYV